MLVRKLRLWKKGIVIKREIYVFFIVKHKKNINFSNWFLILWKIAAARNCNNWEFPNTVTATGGRRHTPLHLSATKLRSGRSGNSLRSNSPERWSSAVQLSGTKTRSSRDASHPPQPPPMVFKLNSSLPRWLVNEASLLSYRATCPIMLSLKSIMPSNTCAWCCNMNGGPPLIFIIFNHHS